MRLIIYVITCLTSGICLGNTGINSERWRPIVQRKRRWIDFAIQQSLCVLCCFLRSFCPGHVYPFLASLGFAQFKSSVDNFLLAAGKQPMKNSNMHLRSPAMKQAPMRPFPSCLLPPYHCHSNFSWTIVFKGEKVQLGYPYARPQPLRQGQTTTPGTTCPTPAFRQVCGFFNVPC